MNIRRSNLLYRLIRALGYVCFHAIYRINVEGRNNIPHLGPAVIVPKHQHWTDIPIVGLAVQKPLNYIAKQELFVYPLISHFMTLLGGISIDRSTPMKSRDSFHHVEQLLAAGDFIVLFPEGTYYPHVMGAGKHRFIQRILRLQEKMVRNGDQAIPFIPMGIHYDEKKLRTEVRVRFGQPLYANGQSDGREFTDRIICEIARLNGLHIKAEKQ